MNIFLNSIKVLGGKFNVRPQHSGGRPSRDIGRANLQEGPATRVQVSSGGREAYENLRRASDHEPPGSTPDSGPTPSAENYRPESRYQRGQVVQVKSPPDLAGQLLSVVRYMPAAQFGRGVVVCLDDEGNALAFDPSELQVMS